MKKIISLILCVVLLLSTLVFTQTTVGAETSGNYEYIQRENGIRITKYTGDATELVIPSTLNGLTVVEIGSESFKSNTNLTSITVPNSVTSIGYKAFYGCVDLLTINLPDNITKIESGAFENTGYYINDYNWENGALYIDEYLVGSELWAGFDIITQVKGDYKIKEGTKVIANNAFYFSDKLTGITIPNSVKVIGDYAFYNCSSLSKISIGNGIEHIGESAFEQTKYVLNTTNYENNVLYIDDYLIVASYYNSNSETEFEVTGNYTIKSGTRFILDNAFSGCDSLTNIVIPNSVTYIPDYEFSYCESLSSIRVDEFNEYYSSHSGILYNKDKSELLQIPSAITNITLPNTITEVQDYMFEDLESLTSVVLPSTITSIGIWAFKNCTSLINITIPNSVTNIDFHAFSGCSSLTNIVIPNSIKMIKQGIFQDCISLTNITLPNTLTYINYDAFYNTGFWNDENNWENNGTVLYLGNYLISGRYIDDWGNCTRETTGEYTIKDGTTLIGYAAFYGCRNLKNITIPRSITIINDRAMGWYWSDSGDPSTEAGGNGDNVLISGFTITGYTNTAAHTYATNNGIPFIDIEKPNTQPTQPSTQPSQPSTHTHSWKYVLTRKATCTEDGYNAYKCSCGQVKTESIKANGHSYVYRYKSATYFASGYECEKCLTCGKTKDYVTYKKLKLQKPNPLYFGYKGKINIYEYTTGVTHYKVQVKGNGRNIIKTFKAKYGSIDKNIKNLKKGKYKVRVKAIVKKGGKKLQSKWSKFRKVTVY